MESKIFDDFKKGINNVINKLDKDVVTLINAHVAESDKAYLWYNITVADTEIKLNYKAYESKPSINYGILVDLEQIRKRKGVCHD